jgi:hypothetical protein
MRFDENSVLEFCGNTITEVSDGFARASQTFESTNT